LASVQPAPVTQNTQRVVLLEDVLMDDADMDELMAELLTSLLNGDELLIDTEELLIEELLIDEDDTLPLQQYSKRRMGSCFSVYFTSAI